MADPSLGQSLEPIPLPRRDPRSPPADMMVPPIAPRRLTPEEVIMMLGSALGEMDRAPSDYLTNPYRGPIRGGMAGGRNEQGRY